MSSVLQYTGKYEEALAVNQRVLAMDEATSGTDSPTIASPLTNIAEEEILLGRYQEAIRDLRRAIPLEESALGSQHQRVALSLGYLGEALAPEVASMATPKRRLGALGGSSRRPSARAIRGRRCSWIRSPSSTSSAAAVGTPSSSRRA